MQSNSRRELLPLIAMMVVSAVYLGLSFYQAIHRPLWMDEVFTVWLVRLPSVTAINHALALGGQYEPPAHPVFLYFWAKLAGSGPLALRLPSIVALLVAAASLSLLVRRYLSADAAAVAFIVTLCPPLYPFALQARPYVLTLACFCLALLLWDDLRFKPRSFVRHFGIVALLGLAIALHFYSALYLVSFGVIEIVFTLATKRFRLAVWVALAAAGFSGVLWLRLAQKIAYLSTLDGGPDFYAKPTLARFELSLRSMLLSRSCIQILLVALVVVALAVLFRKTALRFRLDGRKNFPLLAVICGCSLLPFLVFLLGVWKTGTYNDRYILPSAIGGILLTCLLSDSISWKKGLIAGIAAVIGIRAIALARMLGDVGPIKEMVLRTDRRVPLVIAEGSVFLEAQEYQGVTAEEKARMIYLTVPAGFPSRDFTNEHQVLLWKGIDPSLPVASAASFLDSKKCFEIYDSHTSADSLMDYLRQSSIKLYRRSALGSGEIDDTCNPQ